MSFVGRNDELERLHSWARDERPCIVVTGVGGIGKTSFVKEFADREKFYLEVETVFASLKGEENKIHPIKTVVEAVGKGLEKKIAEWFERRWMEIQELSIAIFRLKKEMREKTEKSLKEILLEVDSRLKGKRRIIVLDDLQVVDKESLRFICELATMNWRSLRWILIHRNWEEIGEGLKDLTGWSHLELGGLNEDDTANLFLKHAEGVVEVKRINKKAFHEVTNGYPNWMETIAHALKEEYKGRKISITKAFIQQNYDAITRPLEHVLNTYFGNEEKLAILSIAIFEEDVKIGDFTSSYSPTINALKTILQVGFKLELRYDQLEKLQEFGLIEINQEILKIHDAKRDGIIQIFRSENIQRVGKVRKTVMEFHQASASFFEKEQNYLYASFASIHAYHHASSINLEKALAQLVNACSFFLNAGDYYYAYVFSTLTLDKLESLKKVSLLAYRIELRAVDIQAESLFSEGHLYSFFEFDIDKIFAQSTKSFLHIIRRRKKIPKDALSNYVCTISAIMNQLCLTDSPNDILNLLRKVPLKESDIIEVKICVAEKLTFLSDSRAKELLREAESVVRSGPNLGHIRGIQALWKMRDFDEAAKLFEESAVEYSGHRLLRRSTVRAFCLAAILTSDKTKALELLTKAEENLVEDVIANLTCKFANAFLSANRKEAARRFLNELTKIPVAKQSKEKYLYHYIKAFGLLGSLENLNENRDLKEAIEGHPFYKIKLSLDNKKKALALLNQLDLIPMHKNILKNVISQGSTIKMDKFIAYFHTV